MKIDLLQAGDLRWKEVLDRTRHEFYHEPGYVSIEAKRMNGEPAAVWASTGDQTFLLPVVKRELPPEIVRHTRLPARASDLISPYGYPGPLVASEPGGSSGAFMRQCVTNAQSFLKAHGFVSLFVRMNPILNEKSQFQSLGSLVHHGDGVVIDLRQTPEQLQQQMRARYRSYVNSAVKGGLRARFDECWDRLDAFVRLYHQTMHRVRAADWYFFPRRYFEDLRGSLESRLRLCVVERDSQIVAAGLFAFTGGIVQYLFSGSDATIREPHATKLMLAFVRDSAKEEGLEVMHLGGGLGGRDEDSLAQFKRGFSKQLRPFHTWRLVIDEDAYRAAEDTWMRLIGQERGGADDFFPSYRRPLKGAPGG